MKQRPRIFVLSLYPSPIQKTGPQGRLKFRNWAQKGILCNELSW